MADTRRRVALFSTLTLIAICFAFPQTPVAAEDAMSAGTRAGFSPGGGLGNLSQADLDREFDAMAATGAEWVRVDFSWPTLEPTKGSFAWSSIDRVVNAAQSRGMSVLALPTYTPAWARAAGTDSSKYPPLDPADYANFVRAATTRFAPKGVKHWEIWNEPNTYHFWKPAPDVGAYTTLLTKAAAAIRSVDATATVITGGLSPATDSADGSKIAPTTFVERMYKAGAKGHFDALAIHPYSYPALPMDPTTSSWNTFYRLPLIHDAMVAQGDGEKKIWLTEYGAPTGTDPTAVTEDAQGTYAEEAYKAVEAWSWAGPLFWYAARDAGTDLANREHNFGLLHRDFSPKPAYDVFKTVMSSTSTTEPTATVNDVTVSEGSGTAAFTVSLSSPAPATVSVDYATSSGSATTADFTSTSGTLSFATAESSKTITVPVTNDTLHEDTERFDILLSSPTNVALTDTSATASISDDDTAPTLSVNDVTVAEGNSGTKLMTFTVTKSKAAGVTSSVSFSTANGSATSGSDYTANSGTVSLTPSATKATFSVTVAGDTVIEPNESFTVNLSSPIRATIADGQGVGTIGDDDDLPSLRVNDVSVTEGHSGTTPATFTISLSKAFTIDVSVNYATADGTARAGKDYYATSGTVTIPAGALSAPVSVAVIGDTADEGREGFKLKLFSAVNASLADKTGAGKIQNDD